MFLESVGADPFSPDVFVHQTYDSPSQGLIAALCGALDVSCPSPCSSSLYVRGGCLPCAK